MDFSLIGAFFGKVIPLACSIVGFGVLVAVHEFGHFLFCKLFNIHTPTFSIGFGPELYSRKIGQTKFRLAAIPFGGYCEIAGMAEVGQGEQAHAHDTSEQSYANKPFWQKALVLLGGILCNILFAYVAFCIFLMVGNRTDKPTLTIMSIATDSAAAKAGLKVGDSILGVNDKQLPTNPITLNNERETGLLQEIRSNPNKELSLLIQRENKEITIPIIPAAYKEGAQTVGKVGATFEFQAPAIPFRYVFKAAFDYMQRIIGMIFTSLKTLVQNRSLDGLGGPVMIFAQGSAAAQYGFLHFLHFLGLFSLSLAIFNLLPIGALDGGQLLFATIEFIIRRRIPEVIKLTINLASWVLMIGLTLIFTYRELGMLFGANLKALWLKITGLFS